MEDRTIEIRTHTKGKVSFFRARGTVERTERGFEVRYPQEDEDVVLILHKDWLSMERKSLSMRFQRGEEGAAKLRLGEQEGSLPLKTRYYALAEREGELFAAVRYELGEPAQKMIVNIRICPCSEEK